MTFGCAEVGILLGAGAVFLAVIVGVLGFQLPSGSLGDVSALLFGAASVAMFVLSFLVAVMAIFGWQELRRTIRDKVAAEIQEVREDLSHQVSGRLHGGLALMHGRTCREERGLRVIRRDLLYAAIRHSQWSVEAFNRMKKPEEDRLAVARNNLAFYLALQDEPSNATSALQLAADLQDWAIRKADREVLLTCCLVCLRYEPEEEKRGRAREILRRIEDDTAASEDEKKEAREILASSSEQPRLDTEGAS